MSTVTRPRGPLPRRVYWTRRVLVLLVALALVYGVARLLGGGGGGQQPAARAVGAEASTTPPTATSGASPTVAPSATDSPTPTDGTPPGGGSGAAGTTGTRQGAPATTALAQPTGACSSGDLVATPSVRGSAHGGHPVVFTIALTTRTSPACTWTVSPQTLVVKVTSGPDNVWSTQQCPGAIGKQAVVLRNDRAVDVTVAWNGRRSDNGCTDVPAWAQPGDYHVAAAAFGSDPVDARFPLLGAVTRTVTMTPTPTPTPTPTASSTASSGATASSSGTATPKGTATPSGR
jgi:hypothetical protein